MHLQRLMKKKKAKYEDNGCYENEDLRPNTRSLFSFYENEDPVKQKTVEIASSTHIKQQQG